MINLTADAAKAIADYTLADYEHEQKTTKNVIGAIPTSGVAYKPDAKSMDALELAWHVASADLFFLNSVCAGQFGSGDGKRPEGIRNAQDVLAWHEEHVPPAMAKAKGLSGEHLAKPIDFFGMMSASAAWYLTLMVKHGIHHRGQLSSYLRPMGGKVPAIYGPSADTK